MARFLPVYLYGKQVPYTGVNVHAWWAWEGAMWWHDLLWGLWNGVTAWFVLVFHVFGGLEDQPVYDPLRAGNWYDFGLLIGTGSPLLGFLRKK